MRISSIRWGIIWIGIGLFFLAINFEVMDSLVFPRLFSLWPVLLIAIGVELIFRKTKLYFLALLSPLLIAAAFIIAASYETGWGWNFDEFFHGWSWSFKGFQVDKVEIPLTDGIDTLDVKLDCRAVDFRIRPESAVLFSAESEYSGKSPVISHNTENSTEHITYEFRDKSGLSLLNLTSKSFHADLSVSDKLPVRLDLNTKADYPEMDFTDISVFQLALNLESREATLWLGDLEDSINVQLDGKTDKLLLMIPSEMGLEITGEKEMLDNVLDDEFTDSSAGFRTEDYDSSAIFARLNVDASVNSIRVERE